MLDFNWLRTKLSVTDVISLLADFSHLNNDEDSRLLRETIHLSSHVLSLDKTQLKSQIQGRLLSVDNPTLTIIRERLETQATRHAWLCSLSPVLDGPGGPLLGTISGLTSLVNAVAITADGKSCVSISDDDTLKVWDLTTGKERFKGTDQIRVKMYAKDVS